MSILNDDMEAEDAMQVSYIKAYEHLADFEPFIFRHLAHQNHAE
jgi:hypothetical protein